MKGWELSDFEAYAGSLMAYEIMIKTLLEELKESQSGSKAPILYPHKGKT